MNSGMKARNLACFGVLTVILLLSFMSCKKQRIERKYTGDFLFTVNSHTWNMSTGTHNSNFTYEGKIVITDDVPNGMSEKNVYVKIYYKSGTSYETAQIDRNGDFSFPGGGSGDFSDNDHVEFNVSRSGLSSSVRDTVYGVRK